jgi:hypothetical protein
MILFNDPNRLERTVLQYELRLAYEISIWKGQGIRPMSQAGVEVVERAQQMGLLPMFFS